MQNTHRHRKKTWRQTPLRKGLKETYADAPWNAHQTSHTERCHASFQTECTKSQLTTDNLITAPWLFLLKSLLSHSNTLEPPEMQMLCAEMLEKLAHCHSLITSDRLLNQESTWSYESRTSWSNYVRKVLHQTRTIWALNAVISEQKSAHLQIQMLFHSYNGPRWNAYRHSGSRQPPPPPPVLIYLHAHSKTYVMCPVQKHNPDDQMTEHYSHQFIRTSVFSPWPQENSQSRHNSLQV